MLLTAGVVAAGSVRTADPGDAEGGHVGVTARDERSSPHGDAVPRTSRRRAAPSKSVDVEAPNQLTPVAAAPPPATIQQTGPELRVVVVDATTGRELDVPREAVVSVDLEGGWGAYHEAGARVALRGGRLDVGVVAWLRDVPASLPETRFHAPVAPQAGAVRLVVPVWRPVTRRVRAVDEQGAALDGVEVLDATIRVAYGSELWERDSRRDASLPWRAQPSGVDGLVEVTLPGLPVNRGTVSLGRAARRPEDLHGLRGTFACGVLADAALPGASDVVLVPWNGGGAYRGPSGSVSGCPRFREASSTAPLVVRVQRADGTPAAGVGVRVPASQWGAERTDEHGVARFTGLPCGADVVTAWEHGFRPVAAAVEIGRDAEVVLVEPPARTVRVVVEDENGAPVPGARVTAVCNAVQDPAGARQWVGATVAQLDGGVETIGHRTDRWGRAALSLPAGEIEVSATLGGAAAWETSTEDEVRVVLRPPQ